MTALAFARQELIAARRYTQDLLDHTPRDLWFTSPEGVQAHIAWQVGHLAMAEFRLCIYYVRPVLEEDRAVISDDFMAHFRARTRPVADPAAYPPLEDILRTFHNIHVHLLATWSRYEQMDLHEHANCQSHKIITTRMDSLIWVSRHEMLHAGQIGLLRRQLGCEPLW